MKNSSISKSHFLTDPITITTISLYLYILLY